METFAQSLLKAETSAHLEGFKDSPPSQEIRQKFELSIDDFIRYYASKSYTETPVETVTREGPFGVLPPPAKRIIAAELLQGQTPSPMKIYEEHIFGDPVRKIDAVAAHIIIEIEPKTAGDFEEQDTVLTALKCLKDFLAKVPRQIETEDRQPPIVTDSVKAVVHLINRSAVAQYDYQRIEALDPKDIDGAILSYNNAATHAFEVLPGIPPSSDFVSHAVIDRQILDEITADNSGHKIAIPVVMTPKEYMNRNYRSVSSGDHFRDGNPIVKVYPGGSSLAVSFNQNSYSFQKIK